MVRAGSSSIELSAVTDTSSRSLLIYATSLRMPTDTGERFAAPCHPSVAGSPAVPGGDPARPGPAYEAGRWVMEFALTEPSSPRGPWTTTDEPGVMSDISPSTVFSTFVASEVVTFTSEPSGIFR